MLKISITTEEWIRKQRGYQSPSKYFLLSSEWVSPGLQLSDLPFNDNSFYDKTMDAFKSSFKRIGIVIKPSEGCDVISKQLEIHTDLEVITQIYKYLYHYKWKPSNSVSLYPRIEDSWGLWKDWTFRILKFPSFKISTNERHRIVMTLFECFSYEFNEPFSVEYSLSILIRMGKPQNITVNEIFPMRWEK